MTTFLVLVGVALLVGGGAMYLAHAARNDSRWIAGSLLFPFVIPIYYRRHWDELHLAAMVQAAGLVMLVAGILTGLFARVAPDSRVTVPAGQLFSHVAAGRDSGFVDSERALRLMVGESAGEDLGGRVRGERFRPTRVEFIDGVLRLTEGSGFFPAREIAIDFGDPDLVLEERFRRVIGPGFERVPRVLVTWREPGGLPATDIIGGGYRLDLEMSAVDEGRVAGRLQLALPDADESYVAGDFTAYTNHLRYRDGQVDRGYDHEDTLRFVAREFLATQHDGAAIEDVGLEVSAMDALERRARGEATVWLADGREARHVLVFAKGDYGWQVLVPESLAATDAAGYTSVYSVLPEPPPAEPVARRAPAARPPAAAVERQVAFPELAGFSGRGATVEYRNGHAESGVLKGLARDRLLLESIKSGGVVTYRLAETEIAAVRLNSGEVLRLGPAPSGSTPSRAAAAPAPAAAAAQPAPVIAGVDVGPLMNRNVRVTARDGRVTEGVLRGVNDRQRLVVETLVGGGKVDYTVPVDQVVSIVAAGR